MNDLPTKAEFVRAGRNNAPPLGQWRWVQCEDFEEPTHWVGGRAVKGKGPKFTDRLMSAFHLASNHVVFVASEPGGSQHEVRIRYRDLEARTRIEPNWHSVIQKQISEKQIELSAAVNAMIDLVRGADLIQDAQAEPTLLPSLVRRDPVQMKKDLVKLKEKNYPAAKEDVEQITKEIVALHKDLCLMFKAEAARMDTAVETVDKRLFALEIYAGIGEGSKLIRNGKPAEAETPITVRQMMRYMDEECLIDYDKGGMDFEKVGDFDKWVSRPENIARMAPEPRCVVALQVRRHEKEYGRCNSIGEALQHLKWHEANKWTYLLIRNGEQIWRLICEIEFRPRLLPFRAEFEKPLTKTKRGWFNEPDKEETITPDHLDYDEALSERMDRVYEYNRVMFLIQGLLDRSKVFAPHPPINLGDEAHVQKYFKAVFDEETGLPSANPPVWEDYLAKINSTIKKGSLVFCGVPDEASGRYSHDKHRPKYGYDSPRRPRICKVGNISRDRKFVTLTWELGRRTKVYRDIDHARPDPVKPGWFFTKRRVEEFEMRHGHQRVEMDKVFNVEAYEPGYYKKFLCDAYLKGAYMKWAWPLLAAEDWLKKNKK